MVHHFKTDMTFTAMMKRASSTTIPFGWDDGENSNVMRQVAVAFFNQVQFVDELITKANTKLCFDL